MEVRQNYIVLEAGMLEQGVIFLLIQIFFHLYKSFKIFRFRNFYNKSSLFSKCEWLVSAPNVNDKCSNIYHARKFNVNHSCDKLKCKGFLPEGKKIDDAEKSGKLTRLSDLVLEMLLILVSLLGLVISLQK
jgi:hypothetical protein